MQERERTQLLLQLAAARSALDVAINLLDKPQLEMPPGVAAPVGDCDHPKGKRHETYGGHGYCTQCGAKW